MRRAKALRNTGRIAIVRCKTTRADRSRGLRSTRDSGGTVFKEFKTFIARGNVLDLAVGIVVGAAFTSVVNSFVNDIMMPPIGLITSGVDFTELYINLSGEEYASLAEAKEAGAATLNYGAFISAIISFLIVASAVFLIVQGYNRLREAAESPAPEPEESAEPTEKDCPFCLLSVPVAATKCGHCTSELTVAA